MNSTIDSLGDIDGEKIGNGGTYVCDLCSVVIGDETPADVVDANCDGVSLSGKLIRGL